MSSPRRSPLERYLPVGYFAIAALLVVLVLPTTLRPPAQPPPSSGRIDPNEPPDEQLLLSQLDRAHSATAGAGTGTAAGGSDGGVALRLGTGPPRACARGFGVPPRQTESVYAAPCAPAYLGSNGGATHKGVTATEVRVGILEPSESISITYNGPVPTEPRPNENAADRTIRLWQAYFNQAFQLYGRTLRLFVDRADASVAGRRASAVKADEEFKVFAGWSDSSATLEELARRKLVGIGGYQFPTAFYEDRRPYLWSWNMDGTQLMRFGAEYICKKLDGKRAAFAGDPVIQDQRRKFGVISTESAKWGKGVGDLLRDLLARECGATAEYEFWGNETENTGRLATAVTRMRAAGVTTVILTTDPLTPAVFTGAADSQGYHPEWFIPGLWLLDDQRMPQSYGYNPAQWRNAFGISPREMARPDAETDWYRAYKQVDPDNEPNVNVAESVYYPLLQIVNGMQMAGPNLNPLTFERAMLRLGRRLPAPPWSIGGGYGHADHTFSDYVTEIWWDPASANPKGATSGTNAENTDAGAYRAQPGAYRYVRCGRHYALGELPREDPLVFSDGCITPPHE